MIEYEDKKITFIIIYNQVSTQERPQTFFMGRGQNYFKK